MNKQDIGRMISVIIAVISVFGIAMADLIDGAWSGKLQIGPRQALTLIFNISRETNTITMDSPDQGAREIPCEVDELTPDSVSCQIKSLGINFDGVLKEGEIHGNFKQGPYKFPLILKRGAEKANRPQNPQPPYPYSIQEVTVSNDSVSLAGTLVLPEGYGPKTPVVVLVTGSGLQNRDEELFEHRPFAVIADYLARNGIASLRYDDRGFGESVGNGFDATTADFASDARMMVEWLRNNTQLGKIGIIGHSEGGLIAYMLAARDKNIDFIVSIAGPSVKGTKIIAYQNKRNLSKSGIEGKTADDFVAALEKSFDYKLENPAAGVLSPEKLEELYPQWNESEISRSLAGNLKAVIEAAPSNPWMIYFLAYDPAADMRAMGCPALIIYGENDQQVPSFLNLEPARQYASRAVVKSYPGLNHLMQHAHTGDIEEYRLIEETISPEVLADMAAFINSL